VYCDAGRNMKHEHLSSRFCSGMLENIYKNVSLWSEFSLLEINYICSDVDILRIANFCNGNLKC
jgi:hypothetical protein